MSVGGVLKDQYYRDVQDLPFAVQALVNGINSQLKRNLSKPIGWRSFSFKNVDNGGVFTVPQQQDFYHTWWVVWLTFDQNDVITLNATTAPIRLNENTDNLLCFETLTFDADGCQLQMIGWEIQFPIEFFED